MQLTPSLLAATPPFRPDIAPSQAFAHPSWRAARAAALEALGRGESVLVLGAPGTGKTLLLQSLAETLGAATDISVVDDVTALDGPCRGPTPFLAAGPLALEERVAACSRSMAVLRLDRLPPEDVARHVVGRLRAAGRAHDLFEADAILALARRSAGVFREIVTVAGSALFLAEQEGAPQVTRHHVEQAAAMGAVPAPHQRSRRVAPMMAAGAAVAGLGLAVLATAWAFTYGHRPPPTHAPASMAQAEPAPKPPVMDAAPAPAPPAPVSPLLGPVSTPPAVPAATTLAFRGPINNETIGQVGQLSLTIHTESGAGMATAHFHAYAGLIGTGDLTGRLGADGTLRLSGQLLMGRNPFDCSLTGTLNGGVLSGSATFVRVGGASAPSRSTFSLSRL